MRSQYEEVDDQTVRANMTPVEIHRMHEVLGRVRPEGEEGSGGYVPIAPPRVNGDTWHEKDPAAIAILEQIAEACDARDTAMAAYEKAKPKAEEASRISMRHWEGVRRENDRALKLREALAALKAVPRR